MRAILCAAALSFLAVACRPSSPPSLAPAPGTSPALTADARPKGWCLLDDLRREGYLVAAPGGDARSYCIAHAPEEDPAPSCWHANVESGATEPLRPIAAAPAREPAEPPDARVSADGRTRVVVTTGSWAADVESFDVATGRRLGVLKNVWSLGVDWRRTRFVGNSLLLVLWQEPSPYDEVRLFEPRSWTQLARIEQAGMLREFHVEGPVWAFVDRQSYDPEPPMVTWWNVETGAKMHVLALPWKTTIRSVVAFAPLPGMLAVVASTGEATGDVAVVDLESKRVVSRFGPPLCATARGVDAVERRP